ncbi:MAG TPA: stage III sporulation protein AF [Tissierellaceae bacterium]|nr:stage III sporulation protein AF [Tissierellaceae bacterium]
MKISNFIYSWLKDLVILFSIISLIDLIMPKSSIKKHINFVIGLLIIFTVINPFINISKVNFNLDKGVLNNLNDTVSTTNIDNLNNNILDKQQKQIDEVYKEKITEEISKTIQESDNYRVYDINIKVDYSEENYGYIETLDIVLSENKENNINIGVDTINFKDFKNQNESEKNFSQLKDHLSQVLEVDPKNINIYIKE